MQCELSGYMITEAASEQCDDPSLQSQSSLAVVEKGLWPTLLLCLHGGKKPGRSDARTADFQEQNQTAGNHFRTCLNVVLKYLFLTNHSKF